MENQNEQANEPVIENAATEPELIINQEKLTNYIEELKLDQNFSFGVIAGVVTAVLSAVIWAAITVSTQYQIGYMAIGVGVVVGFTIKLAGKGIDKQFGFAGAVLALLGCMLGNFLSIVGFAAQAEGVGYLQMLSYIDYAFIPEIMIETFSPMDVLFYGLAIYAGYKFSFRQITENDIIANAAENKDKA